MRSAREPIEVLASAPRWPLRRSREPKHQLGAGQLERVVEGFGVGNDRQLKGGHGGPVVIGGQTLAAKG